MIYPPHMLMTPMGRCLTHNTFADIAVAVVGYVGAAASAVGSAGAAAGGAVAGAAGSIGAGIAGASASSLIAGGTAAAGLGLAGAQAAGVFSPSPFSYNTASSSEMADIQAQQLPELAKLQAEAELGLNTPSRTTHVVNPDGSIGTTTQPGADFRGYSTADIQGKLLQQQAEGQLANEKEFNPQFIAEALKQEELSNPQGVKAGQDLYKLIQDQIANPPKSPVADELNKQSQERVTAGSGLTPEEQAAFDPTGASPGLSDVLTTGFPGEQRLAANAKAGTDMLSSGATPDDLQYRAEQQNLSNLASFIAGKTPENQFGELSGAATSATPAYSNTPQPTYNQGALQQGTQAGLTQYGQETQAQLGTPNPWMAGVSGVLSGANVVASAARPRGQ